MNDYGQVVEHVQAMARRTCDCQRPHGEARDGRTAFAYVTQELHQLGAKAAVMPCPTRSNSAESRDDVHHLYTDLVLHSRLQRVRQCGKVGAQSIADDVDLRLPPAGADQLAT